jgi:hypothetical protein
LTASLVITTRNRRDDLRTVLRSAVQQAGLPEIIVIDDGSNDGTAEMVRVEFPSVIVHRREDSRAQEALLSGATTARVWQPATLSFQLTTMPHFRRRMSLSKRSGNLTIRVLARLPFLTSSQARTIA